MPVLDLLFAIGLSVLFVLLLLKASKQQQQQQQLDDVFYRLLEADNGQISMIQLAAGARVDALIARQYLDHQAKAFGATPEVDIDGDTFYRFPKLHGYRSSSN